MTTCAGDPQRMAWLQEIPRVVKMLERRWSLTVGAPFDDGEGSCAWVAPVKRADGGPAVLKLSMPHFEGEHEIDALEFWNGDGAVRLLDADREHHAMLLEACQPGGHLRMLPEPEQDLVIAGLLRRLWRTPAPPHPFRPLSEMTALWRNETLANRERWPDPGLVEAGLQLFNELPVSASTHVLLATDLHAGNVLRAEREPWLVIDPKPFVGDPAYDATQHLLDCRRRLLADPFDLIKRFSELLGLDAERVRLWTFARVAAETFGDHEKEGVLEIARRLAP